MQVQIQKALYVVLMYNIFRSGHCMWHFCVDKICELQIIGSRVIYLFFGRVTSPEYASVAQMAEHRTVNPSVAGSNPVRPATRSIAKVAYQPHTLAVAGSSPVSAPIVHAMTLNRLFMSIGRT